MTWKSNTHAAPDGGSVCFALSQPATVVYLRISGMYIDDLSQQEGIGAI